VLYKILLKGIAITNYKQYFKYFTQLLWESSTNYKMHLAELK